MNFKPKTDKEIAEENLLPRAEYDYEVIEAEDKTSKSGNEMIALKLRVFHGEEGQRTIKDYLLESMPGKLRNFCVQHDLMQQYEAGTLCAADCEGRTGRVFVGIEKDKSGQYPDKNCVVTYVVNRGGEAAGAVNDSDVPF